MDHAVLMNVDALVPATVKLRFTQTLLVNKVLLKDTLCLLNPLAPQPPVGQQPSMLTAAGTNASMVSNTAWFTTACSLLTILLASFARPAHLGAMSAAEADVFLQSGDAEKDKLRASLGSAILAERPNVKVSGQYAMVTYISVLSKHYACCK